jgi:hypothetical protein
VVAAAARFLKILLTKFFKWILIFAHSNLILNPTTFEYVKLKISAGSDCPLNACRRLKKRLNRAKLAGLYLR